MFTKLNLLSLFEINDGPTSPKKNKTAKFGGNKGRIFYKKYYILYNLYYKFDKPIYC